MDRSQHSDGKKPGQQATRVSADPGSGRIREKIKVVGVGGGGSNALNHIIRCGAAKSSEIEFIALNTDQAHLNTIEAENKLLLGKNLTNGLGAGSNPEVGKKSAMESIEDIRKMVSDSDMVFLTAGMGGGTGTGATPLVAEAARSTGALVVAVVTKPFSFEGRVRGKQAESGVEELISQVDALITIPNDRLLEMAGDDTTCDEAYALADDVLRQAVQGVTDLILKPGLVNVDFADVRAVLKNAGTAVMGIGEAEGEGRAERAAEDALRCPLVGVDIRKARGVLFNVAGGRDLTIKDVKRVSDVIQQHSDMDAATIIWGQVQDDSLEGKIRVTVIISGFDGSLMSSPAAGYGNAATEPVGTKRVPLTETEIRSRDNAPRIIQDDSVFSIRRISAASRRIEPGKR